MNDTTILNKKFDKLTQDHQDLLKKFKKLQNDFDDQAKKLKNANQNIVQLSSLTNKLSSKLTVAVNRIDTITTYVNSLLRKINKY